MRCHGAAFEVGLSLDHGQGVYSGWSDVVVSSQLRLCHTCIIDVMGSEVFTSGDVSHQNIVIFLCYKLFKMCQILLWIPKGDIRFL